MDLRREFKEVYKRQDAAAQREQLEADRQRQHNLNLQRLEGQQAMERGQLTAETARRGQDISAKTAAGNNAAALQKTRLMTDTTRRGQDMMYGPEGLYSRRLLASQSDADRNYDLKKEELANQGYKYMTVEDKDGGQRVDVYRNGRRLMNPDGTWEPGTGKKFFEGLSGGSTPKSASNRSSLEPLLGGAGVAAHTTRPPTSWRVPMPTAPQPLNLSLEEGASARNPLEALYGRQPEGDSIATKIQTWAGQTQNSSFPKFGEGPLEFSLRRLGRAKSLGDAKRAADILRRNNPGVDDETLAKAIGTEKH